MVQLNKPRVYWDMDFVQELDNFTTEDVKILGSLFTTTLDTSTIFVDG